MIEKKQYFELINLLNKSNKTKNETTEFVFFIENDQLYFGQPGRQKIIIATCGELLNWRPAGATNFFELERLISNFINVKLKNLDQVNLLIIKSLFNLDTK